MNLVALSVILIEKIDGKHHLFLFPCVEAVIGVRFDFRIFFREQQGDHSSHRRKFGHSGYYPRRKKTATTPAK